MIRRTWEPQKALDWLRENAREVLLEAAEHCLFRYFVYAPVDTGFMVSTAGVEPGVDELHLRVVVTAPYAVYVEFGHYSVGGRWVAPNPALRMAVSDTVSAFPQIAASVNRSR